MSPNDLRHTLASLGLSQAGASRLLGVSPRTVRFWIAGEARPPASAVLLLRLLQSGKLDQDDIRQALAKL